MLGNRHKLGALGAETCRNLSVRKLLRTVTRMIYQLQRYIIVSLVESSCEIRDHDD